MRLMRLNGYKTNKNKLGLFLLKAIITEEHGAYMMSGFSSGKVDWVW